MSSSRLFTARPALRGHPSLPQGSSCTGEGSPRGPELIHTAGATGGGELLQAGLGQRLSLKPATAVDGIENEYPPVALVRAAAWAPAAPRSAALAWGPAPDW